MPHTLLAFSHLPGSCCIPLRFFTTLCSWCFLKAACAPDAVFPRRALYLFWLPYKGVCASAHYFSVHCRWRTATTLHFLFDATRSDSQPLVRQCPPRRAGLRLTTPSHNTSCLLLRLPDALRRCACCGIWCALLVHHWTAFAMDLPFGAHFTLTYLRILGVRTLSPAGLLADEQQQRGGVAPNA